eukprot:scaffold90946_cov61-Phaeocystis_antarctica.AAC.6
MERTRVPLALKACTGWGSSSSAKEPWPSWPAPPAPQEKASNIEESARVCLAPHAMDTIWKSLSRLRMTLAPQEVEHRGLHLRLWLAEPQLALFTVAPREDDAVLHQCDDEIITALDLLDGHQHRGEQRGHAELLPPPADGVVHHLVRRREPVGRQPLALLGAQHRIDSRPVRRPRRLLRSAHLRPAAARDARALRVGAQHTVGRRSRIRQAQVRLRPLLLGHGGAEWARAEAERLADLVDDNGADRARVDAAHAALEPLRFERRRVRRLLGTRRRVAALPEAVLAHRPDDAGRLRSPQQAALIIHRIEGSPPVELLVTAG